MLSNTALRDAGMRVLTERLGLVEAERFVALLRQDHFDYTEWRRGLYKDVPLGEFLRNAQDHRNGGA